MDEFANELFSDGGDGADEAYEDATYQEDMMEDHDIISVNLRGADKEQVSPHSASQMIRRAIIHEAQHAGFERATEDAMIEIERHAVFCASRHPIFSKTPLTCNRHRESCQNDHAIHRKCLQD